MATRAVAFHAEVKRKVGHVHRLLIPEKEPTWRGRQQRYKVPSSIDTLYPDNAGLAAAMGFGKVGEHKKGSKAYRHREGFMGQARRWRTGAKSHNPDTGKKWGPRLRSAGRTAQRKRATPGNDRQVLDLMATYGVTVRRVAGTSDYDERDRDIKRSVFVAPDVLAYAFDGESFAELAGATRLRWGALAEAFLSAWSFAYSNNESLFGRDVLDEIEAITFQLGRPAAGADYEYGIGRRAA